MTMTRRTFTQTSLSTAALVGTGTAAKAADVDVVVIGAGAAGLAATDVLMRKGYSVRCIEAAGRIGGRVHTDTGTFGVPFDYGAHWLHNKSLNPFVKFGKRLGLNVYKAPWNILTMVKGKGSSDQFLNAFGDEYDRITKHITAATKKRKDISAFDAVSTQNDWSLTAFAHIGSLSMARDMGDVSAMDWYSAESGVDWFCEEGFGTLLALHWANIPVTLNTAVSALDASSDAVTVKTTSGDITAKSAVVTVSQGVLASGAIRFGPALDASMTTAIKGITMGSYNHIALQFAKGAIDTKPDSWIAYHLTERKNGGPVGGGILTNISGTGLCSFEVGGNFGKSLEARGEAAMIDFALSEMSDLFGADIHKGFIKGSATRWGKNPLVHGSYSGARPGMDATRRHLRTPIGERIFLAGEATSFGEQATVSGAHKEGLRAAVKVGELLA
jgi:monoamine oxidase